MLADTTLLIAGAGAGLGAEIARVARREGAQVVLAARRQHVVDELAAEIDPTGEHALGVACDLRERAQCERLVERCVDVFGGVHAVVTCAVAGDALVGGIQGADLDEWRAVMETNLFAAMHVVDSAAKVMTRGGSIVFIGSQSAFLPNVVQAGYAASKGALLGAATHLAAELGPRGIRVNTVAPGWMWGPSLERSLGEAAGGAEATIARVGRKLPLGTVAHDEDVAEAAVFLASSRSRAITGQCLLVNAGEYAR